MLGLELYKHNAPMMGLERIHGLEASLQGPKIDQGTDADRRTRTRGPANKNAGALQTAHRKVFMIVTADRPVRSPFTSAKGRNVLQKELDMQLLKPIWVSAVSFDRSWS